MQGIWFALDLLYSTNMGIFQFKLFLGEKRKSQGAITGEGEASMANMLNYDIVVSKFKLKLVYYIHF